MPTKFSNIPLSVLLKHIPAKERTALSTTSKYYKNLKVSDPDMRYKKFLVFYSNYLNNPYNSNNTATMQRRNFENLFYYENGDLNFNRFLNSNIPPGPNYKNTKNFFNALMKRNKAAMYRLSNMIYNQSRNSYL